MNLVGIQSLGTVCAGKLEEGYRMIRDAGFDCVDFNFDEYLNCHDVYAGKTGRILDRPMEEMWKDFEPHYNAAKHNNLSFVQMHAPFPMLQPGREAVNAAMTRITVNCMELCARMGGKYMVVHPITLAYERSKAEEHRYNIEMYQQLIPAAKQFGLVICLENLFLERNQHLMEGACSDFTEAAAMIDELNDTAGEERFGFCLDVGHANILGKNLYQSVVTMGSRLKILHIHDNDGNSDLHNIPYTFSRSWSAVSTDWEGFLRGLREIGYQGVLNFETFRGIQSFPEELRPDVLKLLANMGRYFSNRIEG